MNHAVWAYRRLDQLQRKYDHIYFTIRIFITFLRYTRNGVSNTSGPLDRARFSLADSNSTKGDN